jgi:predicted metal-dependent hydrolase
VERPHPLYLKFFHYYHQEAYWEAHEVLEELWQGERHNDFFHGLIQIAAIMHQLQRGKVRGARKLATSALSYLKPFAPVNEGVRVDEVVAWLHLCLKTLPEGIEKMEAAELASFNIPVCPLPTAEEISARNK